MRFVAGNRAIHDHAADGKDLHLFEILSRPKGDVRYIGQMACAGYEVVPDALDRNERPRVAIVFLLTLIDALHSSAGCERRDLVMLDGDDETRGYWAVPLHDLQAKATVGPQGNAEPRRTLRNAYRRSEAVRVYVLRRANGICEGCGAPAPFAGRDGRPYLEPHHTRRLSDGGPDDPAHVIALCPTCHRRAHYASDGETFNVGLVRRLLLLEKEVVR